MLLPILLLLAQVGPKVPVDAKPAVSQEKRILKVGEIINSPVKKATSVTCGNRSVVQATLVDGRFELKGLAAGETPCTFSGDGPAMTIEFAVGAPRRAPAKDD
jgi:hypothetical protein